jgi:hypothetical protein
MTFTAQFGTSASMPGNIALGFLPPQGSGTGGAAPMAKASAATPKASASHIAPAGRAGRG